MKKQSTFKMKGPGQKSPTKAIGGKYMEGFKKMTTKQLFDVVKRNDRALESGRKEIVKRTQERGDANSIYQAMTANDSTNAAKRVIQQRIQKGTFDDGSLKKGENPFKMKGFSGFGNSPTKKIVGGGTGEKFKKGRTYYKSIDGKTVKAEGGYRPFISGAGGVASKKHRETYKKVGEYRQAGNVEMFNTQVKKAAKEMKNAQRLNENFRKGMSIQRKRMAIDKPKAKKSGGKIKQTPKPTRTQKIKNFLGL